MSRLVGSNRRTFLMGVAGAAGVFALDGAAKPALPEQQTAGNPGDFVAAPAATKSNITRAFQASLSSAVFGRRPLMIPAGFYRIGAPGLVMGDDTPANYPGIAINGAGRHQTKLSALEGMTNLLTNKNCYQYFELRDLTLRADTTDLATVGLAMSGLLTGSLIERILFENVTTCISKYFPRDGDFNRFRDIRAINCLNFYRTSTPGAYAQEFENLMVGLRQGGVYFYNDTATVGGLKVLGCNGSSQVTGGAPSNVTLISSAADASICAIWSIDHGRLERLGAILNLPNFNGGRNNAPMYSFRDLQLFTDYKPNHPQNTLPGTIFFGSSNGRVRLLFENCQFLRADSDPAYPCMWAVNAKSPSNVVLTFKNCMWNTVGAPTFTPYVTAHFEDCYWNDAAFNG